MIDMTYWCESCARKNNCYTIRSRPKCFTPITSNDRTADRKTEPKPQSLLEAYFKMRAEEAEPQTDDFFREPTAEERKAVAEYIESISVPTGVNIFDLMDEPQTDCSWKKGE